MWINSLEFSEVFYFQFLFYTRQILLRFHLLAIFQTLVHEWL